MSRVWLGENPPPGAGFSMLMAAVPTVAVRDEGTDAVSWDVLTKVVARGVLRVVPLQWTIAPETKLEPLAVRVRVPPPTVADVGAIDVKVGNGFDPGMLSTRTWNDRLLAGAPKGWVTAMACHPASRVTVWVVPFATQLITKSLLGRHWESFPGAWSFQYRALLPVSVMS